MTKGGMMAFLDEIAGGSIDHALSHKLTLKQLRHNKSAIMDAVKKMAKFYRESRVIHPNIREYYESDFQKIEQAGADDQMLLLAVEGLRISMYWQ